MRFQFEWVITAVIAVLVIIAVLIFISPNVAKLGKAFLGFSEEQEVVSSNGISSANIFNSFSREVRSCLDSPDTFCYCQLSNTFIPSDQLLEFENVDGDLYLSYYKDVPLEGCGIQGDTIAIQEEKFDGFVFYFEDSYGIPDVDTSLRAIRSGFVVGNRAYLSGHDLCSSMDVRGNNKISFRDGILYKPDRILGGSRSSSGILLTRKQEGLRPCGIGSPITTRNRVPEVPESPPVATGQVL